MANRNLEGLNVAILVTDGFEQVAGGCNRFRSLVARRVAQRENLQDSILPSYLEPSDATIA